MQNIINKLRIVYILLATLMGVLAISNEYLLALVAGLLGAMVAYTTDRAEEEQNKRD